MAALASCQPLDRSRQLGRALGADQESLPAAQDQLHALIPSLIINDEDLQLAGSGSVAVLYVLLRTLLDA